MDFNTFKLMYVSTMLFYQTIEHDIKFIYAYMHIGDINKHFAEIENKTLGQMIRILEKLDNEDHNPLISANDYNFLKQICDNRNHWAHKVFTEFLYGENWINTQAYKKQCAKLEKDYLRIKDASSILEKIRIKYCTSIRN